MLVDRTDRIRIDAGRRLDPARQAELGQFMTPATTARLMASMFETRSVRIRLLDAGAGVGSLTAAWIAELCARTPKPAAVHLVAYELDEQLAEHLKGTLKSCEQTCRVAGVGCETQLRREDFVEAGARMLDRRVSSLGGERFDAAILNPPYRKWAIASHERLRLRRIGVEATNLYAAFLAIAIELLAPGGEIVAITPRSFCNGPYFKPFRRLLLKNVRLRRVHLFESRTHAFRENAVLQENIIVHAVKEGPSDRPIQISSSTGPDDDHVTCREIPYGQVVRPDDPDSFIHLVGDEVQDRIATRMRSLGARLGDIGVTVSTGRVVDFRATRFIRQKPGPNTVPLIYASHFDHGFVRWPKPSRKASALAILPGVDHLLVPSEPYVLVKRFSAKEEPRRVVAAVYDPARLSTDRVGFENHLNYFHRNQRGLPEMLAKGLALFLNSSLVDLYFRQFNGHTQVNATDLRSLSYPDEEQLLRLGARMKDELPSQDRIDDLVEDELFGHQYGEDPVKATKKVQDAMGALRALGFPRPQIDERSALTLLALVDLTPKKPWAMASDPLIGISSIMDFAGTHYGRRYRPNTQQTLGHQTVDRFLDAGLVVVNPDEPSRLAGSSDAVYQIEPGALSQLRCYGAAGSLAVESDPA